MIDPTRSIASIVLEHSPCAAVFQRHRIDFCCHGDRSVSAAAEGRGLAVAELIAELDQAIAARRGDHRDDPRELDTPRLIAHIVATHHDTLRQALPFVRTLAHKVGRVHGDTNPKLRALDDAVGELTDSLLPHLDDEEQNLFPALTAPDVDQAQLQLLLDEMMSEHLAVADLLDRIRAATDDFTLPSWACNSYRTLFAELSSIEGDIFTHVHLENHVLKPRFDAAQA